MIGIDPLIAGLELAVEHHLVDDVAVEREFCSLGVERLAIVEFHARPKLDEDLLAVVRGLVGQRELRHDVEFFVDVEQLVAKRRKYDAADIGTPERRIENVRIFGKADAQRGLGLKARSKRQQQRRRRGRETQDFHWTVLHLQTPAAGIGSTISTPEGPAPSAGMLKAATNRSSAGENAPSAGTIMSGG